MLIINEHPIHIIADENMVLTNGESYSTEVWLGIYDSPSNWREISILEVPDEQLFESNSPFDGSPILDINI